MSACTYSTPTAPRRTPRTLRGAALAASICLSSAAWAIPAVDVVATDLVDVITGQDLWEYNYSITGLLGAFESVELLFPAALYSSLTLITADAVFETPLETQPSAPDDGLLFVSPTAELAAGATANVRISFVSLGAGAPGPQAFIYRDDAFSELGTGTTTVSAIPEPANLWLMLAGLGVLAPLSARAARRR